MPSISNMVAPDRFLTNFSLKVAASDTMYRAHTILPTVNVAPQTGLYRIYKPEAFRENRVRPVADATQTAAGDFDYDRGTYHCEVYGLHVDAGPQKRAAAAYDNINLGQDAVNYLMGQMLRHHEQAWYDSMFTTGIWSTDLQGVDATPGAGEFTQFDETSSDPIGVIKTAMFNQQVLTGGIRPNTLVLTRKVFDVLVDHPDIIDRINRGQTTGPAMANEETLAAIFGLQRVVVLEAVTRDASGNNVMLGGNNMLLMYLDSNATAGSITAAAKFAWTGLNPYMTLGMKTIQFELGKEVEGSLRTEIKDAYQYLVTAPDLGTFFADVVSASA